MSIVGLPSSGESGHDKGRRAASKRTDTTGRDISKVRSVDFVRISQRVKAAIRSSKAQSFCSYPAGECSGEDRREAMKRKFGQVWLPTQVMRFGPLITSPLGLMDKASDF